MSIPGAPGQWAARQIGLFGRFELQESARVVAGLTLFAALLWWTSLEAIDPLQIGDLGLITALPPTSFVALTMLVAGFVLALNCRPLPQPLLAVSVVLLVLMLHGVTSSIQEVPRFSTTYVHAGFAEAIMRTGELFVNRDARFSWPVFFALGAFLTSIAGLDNPISLADWIPAASNLLYLMPLWLIFRAFTADRRLAWLGLWLFVAANWVGQDYFSPQGFNVLLYLTIVAILLTWFRSSEPTPLVGIARRFRRLVRSPSPDATETGAHSVTALSADSRAGLVLVLVLLLVVDVASHQLTPFVVLASTAVLVVSRSTVLRGVPVLVGVLLGTWLTFMTLAYLSGHIHSLLSSALQADVVANEAIGNRLRGNPGHTFIVFERMVFSAAFWGVAFLGAARRLWNGHWDLALGLLAVGPFTFLGLQSYGGEILLRVYLFALPFMSFFAAALFYARARPVSKWQPLLLFVTSVVLIGGFLFARYGNDQADAITADEVAAADRTVALIQPGSVVVTANHNSPLGYRDYESFGRAGLVREFSTLNVATIVAAIDERTRDRPVYLFLSRSQQTYFNMIGLPPDAWDLMMSRIEASSRFDLVFRTRDAVLFRFVDPTAGRVP